MFTFVVLPIDMIKFYSLSNVYADSRSTLHSLHVGCKLGLLLSQRKKEEEKEEEEEEEDDDDDGNGNDNDNST